MKYSFLNTMCTKAMENFPPLLDDSSCKFFQNNILVTKVICIISNVCITSSTSKYLNLDPFAYGPDKPIKVFKDVVVDLKSPWLSPPELKEIKPDISIYNG